MLIFYASKNRPGKRDAVLFRAEAEALARSRRCRIPASSRSTTSPPTTASRTP